MRKPLGLAFALVTCAVAPGCATYASSTAPAADGTSVYVTGQSGSRAALWLCPNTKTGEQCQPVDVERTN